MPLRLVAAALLLCTSACGASRGAAPPDDHLVAASAQLRAKCASTARIVGYAVPCPLRVPPGLGASAQGSGCGHLVLTASPRPIGDAAKVVNGPAWYSGARVRPLGTVTVAGRRLRAVYAPPATNDGSAVMHHVVLIWTRRGHTYAVGFHDLGNLRKTLALDVALARSLALVGPR